MIPDRAGARRLESLQRRAGEALRGQAFRGRTVSGLLFDEPANHLDPAQQLEVYRLLGELWREGRSIVCINQDTMQVSYYQRRKEEGLGASYSSAPVPHD